MKTHGLKNDVAAVIFLFLLASVFFLPVLAKGNSRILSLAGADTQTQYFYWRHFGFNSLAQGLPLWNPYIFSGTPFIGGIQSAIFYPLNIVYLIFQTPFAINLSIALHAFIGSLFMYIFSRHIGIGRPGSTLASVSFAYGAPYFLHIYPGHLSNLSTMIWLPLIFLGVDALLKKGRVKYAMLSSLALSMQILAGHPQYVFYSMIAVSIYFLIGLAAVETDGKRLRIALGFILFVALGILLSAVQLLPTFELVKHSVRESLTYEWISDFSFPLEKLITGLLPNFFGDMLDVQYWGGDFLWEMSVYIGIVPLALAIIGVFYERNRHVKLFLIIAGATLLLALGKHTPLLKFLYNYVPGFNMFRGISKFIFVFSFCLSIIAGYGLNHLVEKVETDLQGLRRTSFALLGFAALLTFMGALSFFYGHDGFRSFMKSYISAGDHYLPPPELTDAFFAAALKGMFKGVLKTSAYLTAFGIILLVYSKSKKPSFNLFIASILLITAADLWSLGFPYLVTFDPNASYMDKELKAFLKKDNGPFRIATPLSGLTNTGMLEGIENIGGYDAIVLKSYSEFINLSQGLPLDQPNVVMEIHKASPLLDLINFKYYIVDSNTEMDIPYLKPVFRNRSYRVYENKKALPRAFIVHNAKTIKGRDNIFKEMTDAGFNPGACAVIEEELDKQLNGLNIQSPAPQIVERSLNKVAIDAVLNGPGLLVLGDAYYPGWKAFVDGKEAKVYKADYIMRAVAAPKGRHSVEFRYEPLSFKIGAAITLLTLVFILSFLVWNRYNE